MADFKIAYDETMGFEGGYANVSGDPGGETYKGIARNFWPNWSGWSVLDSWKNGGNPNWKNLMKEELEPNVQDFYKQQFWNRFLGDQITNQEIANELFDSAVNMGMSKAVSFLQEALSIFQSAHHVVIDGNFGGQTLGALNFFLNNSHEHKIKAFLLDLNVQQGAWYHHLAKEHGMNKFIEGWYKRVELR
jgi:lysozyme family protein